ncbi:MAG: lipopolysaccharide heptosyltransferase II [Acidiferrobacteraceae bacterium]|nr:lipopolysaccharide heptosyltransferase II [Acidiferrobacteraceae bacterium]|tara:strand:+ start:5356 stop:6387 length:1032 start_codon:yes stop_codon:yes gene_type:complete
MAPDCHNVLVVGPSWIGDMVMAQSLFQTLLQKQDSLQLSVMAPSWSSPLLYRMPQVSSVIPTGFEHGQLSLYKRWDLAQTLRERKFDQAIILPRSIKAALVPFLAGIPQRTGYLGEKRYGLLNDVHPLDTTQLPLTVQKFVQLGRTKGDYTCKNYPTPRLRINRDAVKGILDNLGIEQTDQPVLAICPGAEFGPSKRWPAAYFAQVAQHQALKGWQVWLLGSEKDSAITAEIHNGTRNINLFDLAGQTTLEEVIDLLSATDCVISNDSGLMHLAAAVNTKVIAIYGSTSPRINPPLSTKATILWEELACSPCQERHCPLGHTNCLERLSAEQVIAELESFQRD